MTAAARSRHIIVAALGTARAGIMVDAVTGVLKIPDEAVEPAPDLSAEQMALISRVANLGERMILLLDPAHLLARQEADQIAAWMPLRMPSRMAGRHDPAADRR